MKSLLTRTGKILFLIFAALLLISGALAAWISSWQEDLIATLGAGSEIAATPAGPVEYASSGDGPPVLVLHGAPGGYDQAALLGDSLVQNGFRVIAPSRPGYLRTPLSGGSTPASQADAMAALLDKLGVSRVGVVGVSAGTQTALEFARRYPARVSGLVLVSPVWDKSPAAAFLAQVPGEFISWAFSETVRENPARALDRMLVATSSADETQRGKLVTALFGNPDVMEWFDNFAGTLVPAGSREAGLQNDIAQAALAHDFPYQIIAAPVLLVHGDSDKFLSNSEARAIVARMPAATLLAVPDAGHIVQLGPRFQDTQNQITGFLRQHSGNQAVP